MINEDLLSILDNDGKLLYALKVAGPLRFEEIVSIMNPYEKYQLENPIKNAQKSKNKENKKGNSSLGRSKSLGYRRKHFMSRGTISRHLKSLKQPNINYITQVSQLERNTLRNVQKYTLTPRGRGFINQLIKQEEPSVRPDLFGMIYRKITDFFKSRGFEESLYLPRIINMIARIDQAKFFKLPQTDEMYYTWLFIFQNTLEYSIDSDNLLYFELDNFSQTYKVSKIQILANLEKILEAELGYYRMKWKEDMLFFQKEDQFGVLLFNLIQNAIESEIIKTTLELGNRETFQRLALAISERLINLRFLRPHLKKSAQKLVFALLVLAALNRGLNRTDLIDYWPEFNDLLSFPRGIELSKTIFGITTEFRKIQAVEDAMEKVNSIDLRPENGQ